jgi:hypothetical protein
MRTILFAGRVATASPRLQGLDAQVIEFCSTRDSVKPKVVNVRWIVLC